MWTGMVQGFASLGYLILLVGPVFFPIWYFSLPLFPPSSRIQRDPNSVSDGLLLVLVAIGWALSLPLLGPWLQPKCPFTLIPACRAAPVTLSGVVPATGLSLPLGQHGHPVMGSVHLLVFTAACGVWTTSLPAAVGGLPLTHLSPAAQSWLHSQMFWSVPISQTHADYFHSKALAKTCSAIFPKPLLQVSFHEIPYAILTKRAYFVSVTKTALGNISLFV